MQTIKSLMTTPVISIYSESSAQEAATIMKEKRIGSLLVKGCEGFVGFITERDLVNKIVSEGRDPSSVPVSSIMTESILSMDLDMETSEAGNLMLEYKINHLAVTENENIVGILSIKDLVGIKEGQSV